MVPPGFGRLAQAIIGTGEVMAGEKPLVGVIILNWRDPGATLRCLEAVYASDYPAREVVVVDNSSGDGSVAKLKARYPSLCVLANETNLGYAGGNNSGIRYALDRGAQYVLLLNDDAVLCPTAISHLVKAMQEHPEAGCAGPKVYALEEPERLLSAGGRLVQGVHAMQRGLGELDTGQYDGLMGVDFLSGCALLLSRQAVVNAGFLDSSFFVYYEDVEWCYRARRAGYSALLVPAAKVWHPDTRVRDGDSALVTYYVTRNSLLFAAKHHLGWRVMVRKMLAELILLLNWSLRPRWLRKRPQRDALARGLCDFLRGRFGQADGL